MFGFSFNKSNIERMKERGDAAGLLNALESFDPKVRNDAAEALGSLGSAGVDSLLALLKEGDSTQRRAVIPILAKYEDSRAKDALCWALIDTDGYVQYLAKRVLNKRGDPGTTETLIEVAQHPKATVHVQTALRSVLYQAPEGVAEEALRKLVAMNDSYVLIFAQVDTSCSFKTMCVSSEEADFSRIKQLARQELIRRGLDA